MVFWQIVFWLILVLKFGVFVRRTMYMATGREKQEPTPAYSIIIAAFVFIALEVLWIISIMKIL